MQVDFNILSLIIAAVSICLAVFALWQANEHKKAAQQSERLAVDALTELKSEAKALREYAIPELKSYGEAMREFMFQARVRVAEQEGTGATSHAPSTTTPPTTAPTPTPSPPVSPATKRNLRGDILAAIRQLSEESGKAAMMSLTDSLNDRYEFGLIYGELLMLRDEGIIRWPGDQDSPQPYAGVEIVQKS